MPNMTYSQYSNSILLLFFYTYTQCGLVIEPELNAALAERFRDYNPQLQKFTTSQPKIDLSDKQTIKRQLSNLYYNRFKHNLAEIPDNLNKVIAYYFHGYCPETRKFGKKSKTSIREYDWTNVSPQNLMQAYHYRKRKNLDIEDSLHKALCKHYYNYDPETKTLLSFEDMKDFSTISDIQIRNLYYRNKIKGKKLTEHLNEELSNRFSGYDPETETFGNQKYTEPEPITKIVPQNKQFFVTKKTVKKQSDITYNDVFINGTKILSNHLNTEIKLLCDDTVLAIHGTITNNTKYPNTPTWLVYDTQLQSLAPQKTHSYSGYFIQIKHISDINGKINLFLDNKTTMILNTEKIKKLADGRRFVLERKKHR